MAKRRITHTHNRPDLKTLRAALKKYEAKVLSAIVAGRVAGEGAIADNMEADLKLLVGVTGDREGTTIEKLDKKIAGLEHDGDETTLSSTPAEVHAYDIGLPMVMKRLRTSEGEIRSWGRDDVAEWAIERANYIGSTLKDCYGEQLSHKHGGADAPEPPAEPALALS